MFFQFEESSMSEEEVFLQDDSIPVGENGRLLVALIIGMREEMVTLSRTLKTIQVKHFIQSYYQIFESESEF